MKKVLFVGPYRQSDGWGNAAREYIRALRLTDCDLATRPVYLNMQNSYAAMDEFKDLEDNRFDSYDVIIQNCLPHQFRKYGGVKNIGLSFFETSDISTTPWPASINLMDEMWVSSFFEARTLEDSGIDIPINVIPIPVDANKYTKEYEPFEPLEKHSHEFKFYFIGEYIARKDIQTLLLAFHREFKSYELVRLVLKVNKVGHSALDTMNAINQDIMGLKGALNIKPSPQDYKTEIVIPNYLTEEELYGVHKACDCFVTASSGEAFCMPAFDAAMLGRAPLVNKNSSMAEYIYNMNGALVNSHLSPAISQDRALPFLYTGADTWYQVDTIDLQRHMREAFECITPDKKIEMAKWTQKHVLPAYTYENIALKMGVYL